MLGIVLYVQCNAIICLYVGSLSGLDKARWMMMGGGGASVSLVWVTTYSAGLGVGLNSTWCVLKLSVANLFQSFFTSLILLQLESLSCSLSFLPSILLSYDPFVLFLSLLNIPLLSLSLLIQRKRKKVESSEPRGPLSTTLISPSN